MAKQNFETFTKDGVEMVTLPLEDLQDMIDSAAAAAIMARVRSGEEETFPAELVDEMLDGNPIAAIRKYRGMTQAKLADMTGLTQSNIARAEKGGTTSAANYKKIAHALNIDTVLILPD